jgi:hypothetical protein
VRPPTPRLKNFYIFFLYVHYHKLKKKHLLHVRIRQVPGASPPGPPPGLCPGPTGGFKAASEPPAFYCAPRSEISGSATESTIYFELPAENRTIIEV